MKRPIPSEVQAALAMIIAPKLEEALVAFPAAVALSALAQVVASCFISLPTLSMPSCRSCMILSAASLDRGLAMATVVSRASAEKATIDLIRNS